MASRKKYKTYIDILWDLKELLDLKDTETAFDLLLEEDKLIDALLAKAEHDKSMYEEMKYIASKRLPKIERLIDYLKELKSELSDKEKSPVRELIQNCKLYKYKAEILETQVKNLKSKLKEIKAKKSTTEDFTVLMELTRKDILYDFIPYLYAFLMVKLGYVSDKKELSERNIPILLKKLPFKFRAIEAIKIARKLYNLFEKWDDSEVINLYITNDIKKLL